MENGFKKKKRKMESLPLLLQIYEKKLKLTNNLTYIMIFIYNKNVYIYEKEF